MTKVTVFMPAYNVGNFVGEAIRSILNQTYKDFSFLIINDASTDNTEEIILSFKDPRIVYIKNPKNLGVGHTANLGMEMIESMYVVRCDADDISLPNRIETLVNFMDSNPTISIAGSFYEVFWNGLGIIKNFDSQLELRTRALFDCPIAQPTIIVRNHFLKDNYLNYNPLLKVAEDYDLYLKVLRVSNISIVPEVLVKYRRHNISLTTTHASLQNQESTKLKLLLLKDLTGLTLDKDEIDVYLCYSFHKKFTNSLQLFLLKKVLLKIRQAYFLQDVYSIDFNYYLKMEYEKLRILLIENKSLGFPILFAYLSSFGADFRIFLGFGLFFRILRIKIARLTSVST